MSESARLKLKDRNCKVLPDIWDNHEKLKEESIYIEKLYSGVNNK